MAESMTLFTYAVSLPLTRTFSSTNKIPPPDRPSRPSIPQASTSPRRLKVHGIAADLPAEADPAFAGKFLHHLDRHGGSNGP